MPTQPLWNLGPTPVDFYSMLAGIGKTISHGNETEIERQQRERQLGIQQQHVDLQKRELDQKRDDARSMGEALIAASGQFAQPGAGPVPGVSRSLPTFGAMQGGQPSADIKGVIQSAAAANGVSPEYLTRMAGIESGYDPNARNPSGAAGLFQFVPGTWKQYGGNASPLNPEANAMAAGTFTKDNQDALRQRLGRDPTHGELYLAHQQGAGGAAGLLANPDRPAAEVVGLQAVASNLPRGAGDPRTITAGQFASLWTRRFADLDASRAATPGQPAPGVPAPTRAAPVVVAESEDEVRAAEAGMMPGSADRPAPGAAQAAFTPPPAPDASRVAVGASAGGPAAAMSSPAAPAPAAVLSQGLRSAAQAGMAPRDLALVRAMAMNPALQGHAAQILAKYAGPQERKAYQFKEAPDGTLLAIDPDTAAVAPIAQFAPKTDVKEVGGRLLAVQGENVRDITPESVKRSGQFQILQDRNSGQITKVNKETDEVTILKPGQAAPPDANAVAGIRKEVNSLGSVKKYSEAAPSLGSLAKSITTDTKEADLDFTYGIAKIFDPESVVREGEMVMVKQTGNLDDRIKGALAEVTRGGRLSEDQKRRLFDVARGRVAEYRGQLDRDLGRYGRVADRLGITQDDILPDIPPIPDAPPRAAKGGDKPRVAPGVFTPEQIAAERKRRGL